MISSMRKGLRAAPVRAAVDPKVDGSSLLSAKFGTIRKTMADIIDRQVAHASGVRLGMLEKRVHICHITIQGAESYFRQKLLK